MVTHLPAVDTCNQRLAIIARLTNEPVRTGRKAAASTLSIDEPDKSRCQVLERPAHSGFSCPVSTSGVNYYQPTTTTRGSIDTTQSTRRRGHCEFQTLLLIPVCRRRVDISPELLGVCIMSRCSSELSTLLHHPPHNQSTMHVAILPGLGPQLLWSTQYGVRLAAISNSTGAASDAFLTEALPTRRGQNFCRI